MVLQVVLAVDRQVVLQRIDWILRLLVRLGPLGRLPGAQASSFVLTFLLGCIQ